jgi:hypothetical protein
MKIATKEKMMYLEREEGGKALFFEYGVLKFCILFKKEYIRGMSHLSFYAMSRGLEAFTETGYRSIFAHVAENIEYEEVEAYIKMKLMECGIDVDNPDSCLVLEAKRMVQPSLF